MSPLPYAIGSEIFTNRQDVHRLKGDIRTLPTKVPRDKVLSSANSLSVSQAHNDILRGTTEDFDATLSCRMAYNLLNAPRR